MSEIAQRRPRLYPYQPPGKIFLREAVVRWAASRNPDLPVQEYAGYEHAGLLVGDPDPYVHMHYPMGLPTETGSAFSRAYIAISRAQRDMQVMLGESELSATGLDYDGQLKPIKPDFWRSIDGELCLRLPARGDFFEALLIDEAALAKRILQEAEAPVANIRTRASEVQLKCAVWLGRALTVAGVDFRKEDILARWREEETAIGIGSGNRISGRAFDEIYAIAAVVLRQPERTRPGRRPTRGKTPHS